MRLTEKNRRYILVGMVAFIIIGIFTAKILGSKQDEQFAYEDMLYAQAIQMYQEGNYIDAMVFNNELLGLKPKSEAANYLGGLIAASTGEYKQSVILFQKTLDINPYRVEDSLFMLQYGEIFFVMGNYEEAKKTLGKSWEYNWELDEYPTSKERLFDLLDQLENM